MCVYIYIYPILYIHIHMYVCVCVCLKVKCSRYRPGVAQMVGRGIGVLYIKGKGTVILLQAGVAQRVGRGIALLFHDSDTRRG